MTSDPPGRFTRLVLNVALALTVSLAVYALVTQGRAIATPSGFLRYGLPPMALAAILVGVRRLPREIQVNVVLLLLVTTGATYAAEAGLVWLDRPIPLHEDCRRPFGSGLTRFQDQACDDARRAGGEFDTRTEIEVLEDFEAGGGTIWPLVRPAAMALADRTLLIDEQPVLPLSGLANVTTSFCNESGDWVIYQSDEYGFRNPLGLQRSPIDVALVGDSFVHGHCVADGEDLSGVIRRTFARTLNFGLGGSGPLLELGVLKEFVAPLEPRVVVWSFYEDNDFRDLEREKEHEILSSYLEPGFHQNLRARHEQTEPGIKRMIGEARRAADSMRSVGLEAVADSGRPASRHWTRHPAIRFALFTAIRNRLASVFDPPDDSLLPHDERTLQEVLTIARDTVRSWNGELYFLMLPSWPQLAGVPPGDPRRDSVKAMVESLGVPVIDLYEVFAELPDPLEIFPWRLNGHYLPLGYRLGGEEVVRRIAESGLTGP